MTRVLESLSNEMPFFRVLLCLLEKSKRGHVGVNGAYALHMGLPTPPVNEMDYHTIKTKIFLKKQMDSSTIDLEGKKVAEKVYCDEDAFLNRDSFLGMHVEIEDYEGYMGNWVSSDIDVYDLRGGPTA